MMIGQTKLLTLINNLTYDSLPHSIILCGPYGCGKNLICEMLKDKFTEISFVPVANKITHDFIDNCYTINFPTCFIFNGADITDKEYNALLKLFEEPPINVYLLIKVTQLTDLIPTVLNRAVVWEFEPYTKDELKSFVQKDFSVLEYATTPGQVIELEKISLNSIKDLINLIIDKIQNASVANTLSLDNKFRWKSDEALTGELIDINIFILIFKQVLKDMIIQNNISTLAFDMYRMVLSFEQDLKIRNVNNKSLFDSFILRLKYIGSEDIKI